MSENEDLTLDKLGRIIQNFQTSKLSQMSIREKYYEGKQKILYRKATDEGKPNNKVVTNFVQMFTDSYSGFLKEVNHGTEYGELLDVLKYNDVMQEDEQLYKDALIYGMAAEINYTDKFGNERFVRLDPKTVIPIYSDTLDNELLYAIRFWKTALTQFDEDKYWVEVYDKNNVQIYRSENGFSSFELVEVRPHYYGAVPVNFYQLRLDERGLTDCIYSLQDAYNQIFSDSLDSFDAFADAYLVITGQIASEEDFKDMKKHRVLLLDDGCTADYLVKDINASGFIDLLSTAEEKMRQVVCCPNFADSSFGTQSGIAMKMKLLGLRNNFNTHMQNFKKFLQRRIELISSMLSKIDGDTIWRDVQITFAENIPDDIEQISRECVSLMPLVSKKTLLSQIPFIFDAEHEMKQKEKEEQENMDSYMNAFNDRFEYRKEYNEDAEE